MNAGYLHDSFCMVFKSYLAYFFKFLIALHVLRLASKVPRVGNEVFDPTKINASRLLPTHQAHIVFMLIHPACDLNHMMEFISARAKWTCTDRGTSAYVHHACIDLESADMINFMAPLSTVPIIGE